MTDFHKKYADLIVNYCLDIKEKQWVLIKTSCSAEPFLPDLYAALLKKGAFVETDIHFSEQERTLIDHGNKDQLQQCPFLYKKAVHNFDAIISIIAPKNTKELANCLPKKRQERQKAFLPVRTKMMKRGSEKSLQWTLCVYPTEALAQEAKMSLSEYTNFVKNACFLQNDSPHKEWKKLSLYQDKIIRLLNSKTHFTIKTVNTEFSFSTKNRCWINSDGKRNMPSGEVFSTPVENSVNGHITFSFPSMYQGEDVHKAYLEIKNGNVINWDAEKGKTALDNALSLPGAKRFGEVAIGTNPFIQTVTHNTLFDEKIGGSIHLALGAAYPETGGKNKSALHWDLITDMKKEGQIWADNELIYQKGNFLSIK